jgi:hypothetical protein
MTTQRYDNQLEQAMKKAELIHEQIALLERVREIEVELGGIGGGGGNIVKTGKTKTKVAKAAAPVTGDQPKRRGRPPKRMELPALLQAIAQHSNKPLVLAEFVTKCHEAGYSSKANDYANMVYQNILKLVRRGKLRKDNETRAYEYINEAA